MHYKLILHTQTLTFSDDHKKGHIQWPRAIGSLESRASSEFLFTIKGTISQSLYKVIQTGK